MSIFRAFSIFICSFGLVSVSVNTKATFIEQVTLQKQYEDSDLVLIAKPVRLKIIKGQYSLTIEYTELKDMKILKGIPQKVVFVLTKSEIPELDPICCIKNHSYIFFLKYDDHGRYNVLRSSQGAVDLDKK
jgi:hypothetical protein